MEKNYTVLYIEDNADNRNLVERFLKFEGFEVYSAENGRQGLDKAFEVLPDVCLIDVNLPDINGYEVVKTLNNHPETQNIPKIIFSANDVEPEGEGIGFYYFLPKPVDVNTLATKLEYAVEHPPNDDTNREL